MMAGLKKGLTLNWSRPKITSTASGKIARPEAERLAPSPAAGTGTPTNELMRHILLLTILQESFGFDVTPYLGAAFLLNSASMLV
ncbi:MAG: hypothetical protein V3S39_11500, partial [Thermodesulfobacteriota bacterium]